MDLSIEWLFEEVYRIKKSSSEELHFISDWDVKGEDVKEFKQLLTGAYSNAVNGSPKYNFAYEQFGLKKQIIDFAEKFHSLTITETEITIAPSATISIYLATRALISLGLKRVLVITPAYFSTHEALNNAGCRVFYYHLKDDANLSIDFLALESMIKEQYIEGIIFTDPVYSAGVEFSVAEYSKLAEICTNYDIYFLVDYSLGGLTWSANEDFILNHEKISIVQTCRKYLFIDTLSKRLLLNGIKFSTLIGDENIIDKIDLISETVYGGLSSVQCSLISELYKEENRDVIADLCKKNIRKIQNNYNLVKSVLIGTDFEIINTNSGYFSLINHKNYLINQIDAKSVSLYLLRDKKIVCITKDRLSYFFENNFGFRINLNKRNDELISPLRQCIGVDYSRFDKRQ